VRAGGQFDVVLVDAPVGPHHSVRGFNHLLGESSVTCVATTELAKRLEDGFPHSLDGNPVLLPGENTSLRHSLRNWFDENDVHPRTVGEFDDSALLKTFGQSGIGAFFVHTVALNEVARQYGVVPVAQLDGIVERFYAVSVERRITHPGVLAISGGAGAEEQDPE